jgi:hypothetical protein
MTSTTPTRRRSRAAGIVAGVALLAAAYGVTATIPSSELVEAPFGTRGALGDRIVSQHLIATVHEVFLADEVELDLWRGTTNGIWFVADATLDATVAREGVDVDLFIGGVRYPSSERADSSTVDGSIVDAGFPVSGPMLVELPADVVDLPGANAAVLRISTGSDPRLGSVIELVIDLTQLESVDRVELDPREPGER